MEFATALQGLSFRKNPRRGQWRLFERLLENTHLAQLNVKFPTAYGKTFCAAGSFSILRHCGRVNRILMIVTATGQLDQFCNDAAHEFRDAGVPAPLKIVDVGYQGVAALKAHRTNTAQIFVITVQSLKERRGMENVLKLLQSGQWMICVDEYHHYGIDKAWGLSVLGLPRVFLLAMSATPYRPGDDSAFGPPDLIITYRDAVTERAIKALRGHSYNFRIDVIDEHGRETSYTSAQIAALAGSAEPEQIEKFRIQRKMRWSPKYVSPLVCHPIDRMMSERLATGFKLQALVCAMCVSHAEFVCEQLRALYPELTIEWVGTGEYGRTPEENTDILKKFCLPKDNDGRRPSSQIDVLVHVGIAGEGLDTTTVSEIVFLSSAAISNRALQIIGRAARFLNEEIEGNVNFDASSEFTKRGYVGTAIMDAMDFKEPMTTDDDPPKPRNFELDELPEEPGIRIFNLELLNIDSGDPGVQLFAQLASKLEPQTYSFARLSANSADPQWKDVIDLYRMMRTKEAEEFNEKSILKQWDDAVETAVRHCTNRLLKLVIRDDRPINGEMIGRIKKAINQRKKSLFGEKQKDVEVLKRHYKWCCQLEREIIEKGIPAWCPYQ